jgi:hypothetical protein
MTRKIDPSKWRPAKPGEPGHGKRWFYPANIKKASEKTRHVPRTQILKAERGMSHGWYARLNKIAREIVEGPAKVWDYLTKRRETAEKKQRYKGEKIETIRQFEKAKTEMQQARLGEKPLTKQQYWTMRKFAERHKDTEEEFFKWLQNMSPRKKRRRKRPDSRRQGALRREPLQVTTPQRRRA